MDIIFVPDFSGESAHVFEQQLFLALCSLRDSNAEEGDRWFTVHIASIGDAPEWISSFDRWFNIKVKTFSSWPSGSFGNKLRGLEVTAEHSCALLLDTDVIFKASLRPLANFFATCDLAAAPANRQHLSGHQWDYLYDTLELGSPLSRAAMVDERAGLCSSLYYQQIASQYPYYNTGVIGFRWASGFATAWQRHSIHYTSVLAGLRERAPVADSATDRYLVSNQPSFATVVQEFVQAGLVFRELADSCHARWVHLATGEVPIERIVILHAIGMFKGGALSKNVRQLTSHAESFATWQINSIAKGIAHAGPTSIRKALLSRIQAWRQTRKLARDFTMLGKRELGFKPFFLDGRK